MVRLIEEESLFILLYFFATIEVRGNFVNTDAAIKIC